jgi:hypothetical protein
MPSEMIPALAVKCQVDGVGGVGGHQNSPPRR